MVDWSQVALQAIREARPGPPMAARSLAIVHTSMYNAWTAYDQAAQPPLPAADLTLSWPTFTAAAEEAGLSRIYGGIHFDAANPAGLALGRAVGALVFEKARACWEGARGARPPA